LEAYFKHPHDIAPIRQKIWKHNVENPASGGPRLPSQMSDSHQHTCSCTPTLPFFSACTTDAKDKTTGDYFDSKYPLKPLERKTYKTAERSPQQQSCTL
jgi:hypothetical protein